LINETKGLHVLKGTPRSGKIFFVKDLTHYLHIQGENIFLIATIRVASLQLSQHVCTIHTQFRINVWTWLSFYF